MPAITEIHDKIVPLEKIDYHCLYVMLYFNKYDSVNIK